MSIQVHSRRRQYLRDANQADLFGEVCSIKPQRVEPSPPKSSQRQPMRAQRPKQLQLDVAPGATSAPADSVGLVDAHLVDNSTLEDVYRALESAALSPTRRRDLRSGVKRAARGLDKKLSEIPTAPAELRVMLAEANPAVAGLTRHGWAKVRSLLVQALIAVGLDVIPGRDAKGMDADWRALFDQLPEQRMQCGLSKMLSYFSRKGISSDCFGAADLEAYRDAQLTTSLEPGPETSFNTAAKYWNQAVDVVPGWPQTRAIFCKDARRYSLHWDEFSDCFRADVDEFLTSKATPSPLDDDYAIPVSQATTDGRRKSIRQLASALVLSGFARENLTSLAVLVEVANVKAAMRFLLDRNDGKVAPNHENLVTFLCTVAKHWTKAPADHLDNLRKLAGNLHIKKSGMRPKNRERLRQFDLTANQEALLLLPPRIFEDVRRRDSGTRSDALRAMFALAIEVLIMAPMRRRNLISIEIDRHIRTTRRGGRSMRHIVFHDDETKTNVPFELALPSQSASLLDVYLDTYRPRIGDLASPYLFPAYGTSRRSFDAFSQKLSEFIRRETGLRMHTHLFRHLAAKLHLDTHPEDIETVRRLLGHTSTRTTLKAYADLRNEHAFRRHDEGIAERREQAARVALPRAKSSKKAR